MTQLQFLATLSLVDSTVTGDSWLADFVTGLRCAVGNILRELVVVVSGRGHTRNP